jgi:hypothetical protein
MLFVIDTIILITLLYNCEMICLIFTLQIFLLPYIVCKNYFGMNLCSRMHKLKWIWIRNMENEKLIKDNLILTYLA